MTTSDTDTPLVIPSRREFLTIALENERLKGMSEMDVYLKVSESLAFILKQSDPAEEVLHIEETRTENQLWSRSAWKNATERWRQQKLASENDRQYRFKIESNIEKVARYMRIKFGFEHDASIKNAREYLFNKTPAQVTHALEVFERMPDMKPLEK